MWFLLDLYIAEAQRLLGVDLDIDSLTHEARRVLLTRVNETLINDVSSTSGHQGNAQLVDVSIPKLILSTSPLLIACFVSWLLDLDLASSIVVSSLRTFIQLSVVGFILVPIFQAGVDHWYVVFAYVLFMCLLAAREATSRSKYTYKGLFLCVLVAILVNVALVSIFAFAVIIEPTPVYNPQYVIPICGMLLGNCITGIALSLSSLITSFAEQQAELELMLCFGGTKYEGSARLLREAVRAGTMPTLNGMAVIGLISIPGMMTGQVLGGSPPQEAARYQMLIMYLIAICGFGSILSIDWVTLLIAFDGDHRLRSERFEKKSGGKRNVLTRMIECCSMAICKIWASWMHGYSSVENSSDPEKATIISQLSSPERVDISPNRIKIDVLNRKAHSTSEVPVLQVEKVTRSIPLEPGSLQKRVLFSDFGIALGKGEIATVTGPSGAGKSQFLRLVAGLVPMDSGNLSINGQRRTNLSSMMVWRQKVRYVTQYKISTPGTPQDFIEQIARLGVNRRSALAPSAKDMSDETRRLVSEWGMSRSSVDKEWKELSGGEAQRVIVALAIASRPEVLLLDESTSALDLEAKKLVEESIKVFALRSGAAVLWITHDAEQITRIGNAFTNTY